MGKPLASTDARGFFVRQACALHEARALLRALRGDLAAHLRRFLFGVELSLDATGWMRGGLAFGTPLQPRRQPKPCVANSSLQVA